jgi:hypothetical protein
VSGASFEHLIAASLEKTSHRDPKIPIIVDQEHFGGHISLLPAGRLPRESLRLIIG